MAHSVVAVIPARYQSSRLPGKPLADIAGRTMIQHVYERTASARVDRVCVATDDERIMAVVKGFGGEAVMTSPDHVSGTDRVAEAVRGLGADLVVNVQGDEPLLNPEMIDAALQPLREDSQIPMGTLAHPLTNPAEAINSDVVKVVCDRKGFALYFSRAPIPLTREADSPQPEGMLRHIGLYVYRADFLQVFSKLPPTPLETRERLEQLRALEHGYRIRVVETSHEVIGVDTPDDLKRVRGLFEQS
ncbi:MAG: 3-deoxy-manno-octulosonate cytidylyltransferase [Magnetococcales bacterium]|nr:3-deoxy-manno-octulosonate cytidylyltransferase [Magnetococcales bacterium]